MRIASRRYPYRPLGRGSPRPTPARYVGLCGGDGPPPRLSGGYTRPAHVLGYSNAPSPRGGPTRAAGLWCARSESLGTVGGRLVLLRGCREPTPYTAPAAPAPCGDGQKFHSGRACPRGGGPVGASVGRIKCTAELFCFVFCFVFWSFFVL